MVLVKKIELPLHYRFNLLLPVLCWVDPVRMRQSILPGPGSRDRQVSALSSLGSHLEGKSPLLLLLQTVTIFTSLFVLNQNIFYQWYCTVHLTLDAKVSEILRTE